MIQDRDLSQIFPKYPPSFLSRELFESRILMKIGVIIALVITSVFGGFIILFSVYQIKNFTSRRKMLPNRRIESNQNESFLVREALDTDDEGQVKSLYNILYRYLKESR